MGYAKSGQDTAGIHQRLYSRAFVLVDEKGTRICLVNTDLAMISQIVKLEVRRDSPFFNARRRNRSNRKATA